MPMSILSRHTGSNVLLISLVFIGPPLFLKDVGVKLEISVFAETLSIRSNLSLLYLVSESDKFMPNMNHIKHKYLSIQ